MNDENDFSFYCGLVIWSICMLMIGFVAGTGYQYEQDKKDQAEISKQNDSLFKEYERAGELKGYNKRLQEEIDILDRYK